jgi:hypothetical protein
MNEEKGICIFCYNNEQIDYVKLSIICSLLAKKNLNLPIALITDTNTESYIESNFNTDLIDNCFDYIISQNITHESNKRIHNDSPWYEFVAPFYNTNKQNVFNLSPFNQTLLIDSDYLIYTDNLNKIFDQGVNLATFDNAKSIRNDNPLLGEIYLNPNGIKMYWSTAIYFTKDKINSIFFNLWNHVKENYDYYQMLYKFPSGLYRTDFAISIANHILNGRSQGNFCTNLPQKQMYYSSQNDNLIDVKNDSLLFVANDVKENWKDIAVKWSNLDVHVMNKWALLRNYDKFLEIYA